MDKIHNKKLFGSQALAEITSDSLTLARRHVSFVFNKQEIGFLRSLSLLVILFLVSTI